jgi:micrococcal nuclease
MLLLPSLAAAAPDEFSGVVTNVVDGDTIDVEGLGRVRLADIDCPEMSTAQGPAAKQYATQWLQSNLVYLDIDDKSRTDSYGRVVAVVYLVKPDGTIENFNQKLVDAGQACVWDFSDNEFSPASWWSGHIPASVCIKSDSSGGSTPSELLPGLGASSVSTPEMGQSSYSVSSSNGPFVGSSKSDKYHYPSCSAAKKIKASNLVTFSSSATARAAGYSPCGKCHPP